MDLAAGVVSFTRSVVVGPDGPVLAPTKTDRTHQVELDHDTPAILHGLRRQPERQADAAAVDLTGKSFVFTSDADGRRSWSPNRATHAFIKARRRAGLPSFRLHDLRHFMASEMLAAGVPLATVAQRLASKFR